MDLSYILNFEKNFSEKKVVFDGESQRNVFVDKVKITYVAYPFKVEDVFVWEYFSIPSLFSLAAMKAYAIWRRAKWKDYVDLYFLIKKFWVSEIIIKAKSIFWWDFSEKMFIRQLGYFDDIDYSEEVEFMKWFEKTENEIKEFLFSLSKKYIL